MLAIVGGRVVLPGGEVTPATEWLHAEGDQFMRELAVSAMSSTERRWARISGRCGPA